MSKKSQDSNEPEGSQSRYDDALLSANWNPVVELLETTRSVSTRNKQRGRAVTSDAEADAFLSRIYTAGA